MHAEFGQGQGHMRQEDSYTAWCTTRDFSRR